MLPVPAPPPHLARQTACMAVTYMVRGSTEAECQQALERMYRLLGVEPVTRPTAAVGPGWVARAAPKEPAE